MDNGFDINLKDTNEITLELLVQIWSRQEALVNLVVDKLVEKGADEDTLVKDFDEDYRQAKEHIMNVIYERYGRIDLNGLFDQKKSD